MLDIDTRIKRQLDRLESPGLTEAEIAKIKDKVAYLESLRPKHAQST